MSFNKDYSNKVDEKLKKWFKNTFNFSNNDINKVIFLLRKSVYPYDYISDWEKFIEATPEKEEFYRNLNMEDITDAEYMHAEGVCKDFEIKNLGEYWNHNILRVMHYFWLMFSKTLEKSVQKFII